MKEIQWYFPEQLEELPPLLKKEGVMPHGGGTGILRKADPQQVGGLIDLSRLPLRYVEIAGESIAIGATATYADVANHLAKSDPGHILVKALGSAASTPLRNRITIGGSVAYFPMWSDLMGPLVALDARVRLAGKHEGSYPVTEYIQNRHLRKGTLITAITFDQSDWRSYYHRETRTRFDYPAFTITLLLQQSAQRMDDIRIVITGNSSRFKRLTELEEYCRGRKVADVLAEGIGSRIELQFPPKKLGSPDYITYLAGLQLERGLETLLKG